MGNKKTVQAMEAGAKPFEEIFKQQGKELHDIRQEISQGFRDVENVQDELIDIVEEHDNRLNAMNQVHTAVFEDKEKMLKLDEASKCFLVQFLNTLVEKKGCEGQEVFVNNIKDYLETDDMTKASINALEDITDIVTQHLALRVFLEYAYLETNSLEDLGKYKGILELFSVSPKNVLSIKNSILETVQVIGEQGLINKYSISSGFTVKKERKIYPKLEINLELSEYYEYFNIDVDVDDMNIGYDIDKGRALFRTEQKCKERTREIINKYYRQAKANFDYYSSSFIGNRLAKEFGHEIKETVYAIKNYIDVNKMRIHTDNLDELIKNVDEEICNLTQDLLRDESYLYSLSSLSEYVDKVDIEEETDYVFVLFGSMKEVECYISSPYDGIEAIIEDTNKLLEDVIGRIRTEANYTYMTRIKDFYDNMTKTYIMS